MPLGVVSSIRCFSPNDKRLAIEYINHYLTVIQFICIVITVKILMANVNKFFRVCKREQKMIRSAKTMKQYEMLPFKFAHLLCQVLTLILECFVCSIVPINIGSNYR